MYKLSRRDFLKFSSMSAFGAMVASSPWSVLAQDAVTLRLTAWGNPTEVQAREATLGLYDEMQDAIDIEFIHTPGSEYMTKLQTQLAGGDYPDVMFLGNGAIEPFVARGQLLALDDYLARDNFDTSDISQQNLKLYNVDGVQYGFPVDAPNQQLFYNKTLFDAAGIDPPPADWEDESWNWDAFLEKAIALTDKEAGVWGWQVKTGFRAWWIWVTANGGTFFNEEGSECLLNSPEAVEALQFLGDLIHVHEVAPPLDVASEMGSGELFQSGVTAMETWWPAIGRMRTNIADKFEWNVAPHPAGKAGKSTSGGGTGHTVSAFTQQPDESWEFLKFLISTPCVSLWTDIMGIVPPLTSVAESDVFLKPGEPPADILVFTKGNDYLRPDPRHPQFTQAQQIAQSQLERLWVGGVTAQEVCDDIVSEVNRLL